MPYALKLTADWILQNKEAITIIVWYMVVAFYISIVQDVSWMDRDELKNWVMLVSVIILYTVFGLTADVFIGRYRFVTFSLWIQWITTVAVTFFFAFPASEYQFPVWLCIILTLSISAMQLLGQSAFQVTAIQFGTDQLQDRPSEHFSSFIFWYFWVEMLMIRVIYPWVSYSFSFSEVASKRMQLSLLLFCTVLLSVVLVAKSCFMSSWFLREPVTSSAYRSRSENLNPYRLIYDVLKFTLRHKTPIDRSSLTYWEDEIPSRINLGKSKYGGPFTTEEVEDVKTFLRLIKVLLSLFGIFFTINSLELNLQQILIGKHLASNISLLHLIENSCSTMTVGLLLPTFKILVYPQLLNYIPSMLKRIWIGSMFVTLCAGSVLLIDAAGHAVSREEVPCYLQNTNSTLQLSPYLIFIPTFLYDISYTMFTITLFEFIIAQSPYSMKGVLIGIYYVIRFGIGGLFDAVERYVFSFPTTGHLLSCGTANYLTVTACALLSLLLFTIVACKYKYRKRDEVVNVHIFAEEYYSK